MADLIIPAKHRLALALREPNLLVPGGKPVGDVSINWKHPLLSYNPDYADSILIARGSNMLNLLDGGRPCAVAAGSFSQSGPYVVNNGGNRASFTISTAKDPDRGGNSGGAAACLLIVGKVLSAPLAYNDFANFSPLTTGSLASSTYTSGIGIGGNTSQCRVQYPENSTNTDTLAQSLSGKRFAVVIRSVDKDVNPSGTRYYCLYIDGVFAAELSSATTNQYLEPMGFLNFGEGTGGHTVGIEFAAGIHWNAPDNLLRELAGNPYALVKSANQTPYIVGVPVGGGAPVLSDISAESITSTSVTPRITVTGSSSGGTLYWAVFDGATEPTLGSEIIAGSWTGSGNVFTGSDTSPTVTTVDFDGDDITALGSGTSYKLAAVWDDGADTSDVLVSGAWSTLLALITLTIQNASHSHIVDNVSLTQANILLTADTQHSHSVDNISLVQQNSLVINNTEHSHTVNNIELSQSAQLAIASTEHGHLSDLIALLQANILSAADSEHSHLVDNIGLLQSNLLATNSTEHSHSVDNVNLVIAGSLDTQDVEHGHVVDSVALLQANILTILDSVHSHTVDNIVLVENAEILINSTEHSQIANNITLNFGAVVNINNALHSHTVDNIELTQFNIISIDEATHTQLVDNVSLSEAIQLAIHSSEHSHTVESILLTQNQLLEVQETLHGHFSENVDLTQQATLLISDTLHSHFVNNIILPGTFLSSGRLVFVNSIGKRIVYVASSDRIVYIMKEE